MKEWRISPELAITPLEKELLLCQDKKYLEEEPLRQESYRLLNLTAAWARKRYGDWINSSYPFPDEDLKIEVLHLDTCSLIYNGRGENLHEIGAHGVRGDINFSADNPVTFDIYDEEFEDSGPRLVLADNNSDTINSALDRNVTYVDTVIKEWEDKKEIGLTDYPVSGKITCQLMRLVLQGQPMSEEEFQSLINI